jgi:hypothetical protein
MKNIRFGSVLIDLLHISFNKNSQRFRQKDDDQSQNNLLKDKMF